MRTSPFRSAACLLTLTALLVVSSGCVAPTWVTDGASQPASKIGVTADIPRGWARYTPDRDLVMTRDGFILETIRISRFPYGTKLPNSDRSLSRALDEHEAAQVVIDSLSADQTRHNLTIADNRPVTIDGRPGFRIEVVFRTAEGLTMRETLYVALVDDSYVIARYSAPDRHYHELHRSAFEQVVGSLKIGPMPGKKG